MNSIINLTPAQLRKAANIQEKIQSLQKELNQLLGASTPAAKAEAPKKRKFSASARAKMRKAQKARWAKIKGTAPVPSAKPAQKPKRKMSAAAKARMSAMAKARWAKAKKAGKTRL